MQMDAVPYLLKHSTHTACGAVPGRLLWRVVPLSGPMHWCAGDHLQMNAMRRELGHAVYLQLAIQVDRWFRTYRNDQEPWAAVNEPTPLFPLAVKKGLNLSNLTPTERNSGICVAIKESCEENDGPRANGQPLSPLQLHVWY